MEKAASHARGKKRITLLHKLAELYFAINLEKAFALLQEAQGHARAVNDTAATAHGLLLLARWHSASGNQACAWDVLMQAEALATTLSNRLLSIELLITASLFHYNRDQAKEALAAIEQAHEMSDPGHIYFVQTLASMGFLYYSAGWYDKAYQVLTDTLELSADDSRFSRRTLLHTQQVAQVQAACIRLLAALHTALGNSEAASDYARQGLALCRDMGYHSEMVNLCYTLGELESVQGRYETALVYYREALDAAKDMNNRPFICGAYIQLAEAYVELQQYDNAAVHLAEAFSYCTDSNSAHLSAEAWFCKAGIFTATGANELAIAALHTALQYTHESTPDLRSRICSSLAALYERVENTGEAYQWYKRHIYLEEQLHGRAVYEAIARIRMQHQLRTVETEKELLRTRAIQLEQQTEHKQQIISRMALNLVRKHEGLAKLRMDILSRMEGAQEENRQMFRRIVRSIDNQLASDEDWLCFEQQFAVIHGEFTSALSQRFPRLTPTELRVCMLLRLNFSTKDIADMLSSSVHTVHTHRRRIRKKLGVEKDASLVALLMSVGDRRRETGGGRPTEGR